MSWAEVFRINNNVKKTINEQLQDMKYNPIRVITETGTFTPEKTGLYKVICVGAGADGYTKVYSGTRYPAGGGGGGVAIKNMRLESTVIYDVTVSTTASFSNILTATAGTKGVAASVASANAWKETSGAVLPIGGTASGGDYNFDGETGAYGIGTNTPFKGGSVGVVITDLTRTHILNDDYATLMEFGDSLLNYGGGGPACERYQDSTYRDFSQPGLPAAIIIIPLEMEE